MDEERSVRTYQVLKRYLFSEPLLRGVPLSRNEATIPYMPMNLQKKNITIQTETPPYPPHPHTPIPPETVSSPMEPYPAKVLPG